MINCDRYKFKEEILNQSNIQKDKDGNYYCDCSYRYYFTEVSIKLMKEDAQNVIDAQDKFDPKPIIEDAQDTLKKIGD